MDAKKLDKILDFMVEVDKLKRVKRTGWVNSGIKDPESVADHSFSMAILAYMIAKTRKLDAEKAMIIVGRRYRGGSDRGHSYALRREQAGGGQ